MPAQPSAAAASSGRGAVASSPLAKDPHLRSALVTRTPAWVSTSHTYFIFRHATGRSVVTFLFIACIILSSSYRITLFHTEKTKHFKVRLIQTGGHFPH